MPALDGRIGVTVEACRVGSRIEVAVQGEAKRWSVLLRGVADVVSVEGGTAEKETLGMRIVPNADVKSVIVQYSGSD